MAFLAEGASSTSLPPPAGASCAAGAGAFSCALADAAAPEPALITASLPLACTVLPSSARISPSVPAAGAGTSTLTLSVSNSQSISSCATVSPTFLNHVATVASVTDSPSVGTMTSTEPPEAEAPPPSFGACASSRGRVSSGPASLAFGGSASAALSFLAAPPDLASPSSIVASRASTPTVSPSAATISPMVPATGLGTSTVTLSVSSSQSISSTATESPGFLNHVATVASVTDSPSVGTRTSLVMVNFL